jgi:hypothetical protein
MQIPTETYRAFGQIALRLLVRRNKELVDKSIR